MFRAAGDTGRAQRQSSWASLLDTADRRWKVTGLAQGKVQPRSRFRRAVSWPYHSKEGAEPARASDTALGFCRTAPVSSALLLLFTGFPVACLSDFPACTKAGGTVAPRSRHRASEE